jgi:hypothetical protein
MKGENGVEKAYKMREKYSPNGYVGNLCITAYLYF